MVKVKFTETVTFYTAKDSGYKLSGRYIKGEEYELSPSEIKEAEERGVKLEKVGK